MDPNSGIHVMGYVIALSGSLAKLDATNQNRTLSAESVTFPGGQMVTVQPVDRVLTADVILSTARGLPGAAHQENNYTSVDGGFQQNGVTYTHLSAHLRGAVPSGDQLGYKDGHVQWQKFTATVVPRTANNTPYFWW
jgi:hypothetical protein